MQWAREILDMSMKSDTLGILEQGLDDIFVSSLDLFNIFVECAGVKKFSEMSPANLGDKPDADQEGNQLYAHISRGFRQENDAVAPDRACFTAENP
jgi:hypothetical protein